MLLLSSADLFSKLTYSNNSFRNCIRLSKGLDSEQDRLCIFPDLGTKLFAKVIIISRQQKSPLARKELIG